MDLNPDVVDEANPIDVVISRVITHERYNAKIYTNDIALLKLQTNVVFNGMFYMHAFNYVIIYYVILLIHLFILQK